MELFKSRKTPPEIQDKLKRGRDRMEDEAGLRNVCMEFYRGNQYLWLSETNKVYDQRGFAKAQLSSEEYKHRVWQTRNVIRPAVDDKVSATSQRTPGYEVLPSTTDQEDVAAARLGDRVALAGYGLWNLRRIREKAIQLCLVADESFALPYWDDSIGPYVGDEESGYVGQGEVRVKVFSRNEVMWEPEVEFDESPWYAVEHARLISEVQNQPGYVGGKLKPDANTQRIVEYSSKKRAKDNKHLVMVTDYYERPCPDYPQGRHLTFANGREIFPEEQYPLRDHEGEVIDAPLLHRLYFTADPECEMALGIVRDMIDPQRTVNDCENKAIEWKNVALIPQLLAPEGSLLNRPVNAPGAITYYRTLPGMNPPEWRDVPPVPPELFQIGDRARSDVGIVGHSSDLPAGQIESGKEAQALIETQQMAWDKFLETLAEWDSRLMRDCLTLVQRHYTEPRLLKFRGRLGWESIDDFRGADLRGQTDVRVLPGSLVPRTKQATEQRVMNYAQLGWITPESAMSAINGGTAEKLVDSYEQDVARAHRVIMLIRRGPEFIFNAPMRPIFPGEDAGFDELTGLPRTEVPDWMPRPFDSVPVHKSVFEDWLRSQDYDELDPEVKEAANLYYSALLDLEMRAAQRAQMLQMQQAQEMGMANATKAPSSPMPSLPSVNGNGSKQTEKS